jgi:hypothetical protein
MNDQGRNLSRTEQNVLGNIKYLMHFNLVDTKDLANHLNIQEIEMNHILSGSIALTLPLLESIAQFFNTSPIRLLSDNIKEAEKTDEADQVLAGIFPNLKQLIANSVSNIIKKNVKIEEFGISPTEKEPIIRQTNTIHTPAGLILEYETRLNDERFVRKFCQESGKKPDIFRIMVYLNPGLGLQISDPVTKREKILIARYKINQQTKADSFEFFGYKRQIIRAALNRSDSRDE